MDRLVRNYGARPEGTDIDCIIIHHTGGGSISGAIDWWNKRESEASAHFLIDREGNVTRCVQEKDRAWHAGVSELQGARDVNDFSIGIELLSTGSEFPKSQMDALADLTVDLMRRFSGIRMDRIVGHSDVALPKGRKSDPGQNFNWPEYRARVRWKLAELGL